MKACTLGSVGIATADLPIGGSIRREVSGTRILWPSNVPVVTGAPYGDVAAWTAYRSPLVSTPDALNVAEVLPVQFHTVTSACPRP